MSEEENKETQESQELSPDEERALNDGWMEKSDWEESGKDPEEWVDYREFNRRGELMGRIKEQSGILASNKQEINELRATVQDLVQIHSGIAEREYNKLLKSLRDAKAEAIENGDGETVTKLEEDIDTLKAQRDEEAGKLTGKKAATSTEEAQLVPEVQAWLNDPKNNWYHTDTTLRASAMGLAHQIRQESPDMGPAAVLQEMEKRIKQLAPHKFRAQSVGSGDQHNRPTSGGKRTRTFNDLSPEEQAACVRFEKTANLPREEYIKMLDDLEG